MAGERQLIVKIVGDDKSLQAAFARSTASTKAFAANTSRSLSGGVSVGKSFEPLLGRVKETQARADALSKRLAALDEAAAGAGAGAGKLTDGLGGVIAKAGLAGIAITSAYTASRRLSDALTQTGEDAFTASGKISNFGSALLGGDIVGAFQALNAQAKTLDEAGISAEQATGHYKAFKAVITSGFEGSFKSIAEQAVRLADGLRASQAAADALADSTARLGTVFRTASGDAVVFKGAVDDLAGPHGPGAVDAINAALEQASGGFSKDISPGASRQAKETIARASGDLQELLRLQRADQSAAKEALATSKAVGKDREALNQSLADATAAVITTRRAIAAQNTETTKTVSEVQKADPAAAWAKIIAGLELGVDRAGLTTNLNAQLGRLNDLKDGLERQVKSGVDVAAAQAQLVTVAGQIAAKQKEIRDKLSAALQAKQFRSLGLSATGDEVIPGPGNLAKRLKAALAQVDSGDVDISSKLASHLREAQKTIAREGDKLTNVTRAKINEFIKAANGGDATEKLQGPLTKTTSLNTNKLLEGLGLTPDLEKLLRSRLSGFNSGGVRLAGPGTRTGGFAGAQRPIIVENHNVTVLDGKVIASSVTRSQERTQRRNPKSKRGTRHGI